MIMDLQQCLLDGRRLVSRLEAEGQNHRICDSA